MNALSSTQAWVVDHELALGMVLLASLGMALLIALLFTHRRDLQRLRKALRERELGEARLDMALDASGAAQWEWHIPEKRIALSDRYYEQLGYPPGAFEATQEQWRMLLHPDDVERALAEVRRPCTRKARLTGTNTGCAMPRGSGAGCSRGARWCGAVPAANPC